MFEFEYEFIDASIFDSNTVRYGKIYSVYTTKTGATTWETRAYNSGYEYSGPIDRAVTHCAALVEEIHESMVARYS